ncbi:MAG: hypothetical protein ACI8XB_002101 [Patiriisocius sp.]|jgi:hypothetical protein
MNKYLTRKAFFQRLNIKALDDYWLNENNLTQIQKKPS